MADVLFLVHRRHDDADQGLAAAAAVGADVGDRPAGGQRLDLDQRHAADLARRRRRRLEQVERSGQQADRHADRLEGADQVEQALVVGVLGADHDAVGAVAVDDLQRGDAIGGVGAVLEGGDGADDAGVFAQRLVRFESLGGRVVTDQDPALDSVEASEQRRAERPASRVEDREGEPRGRAARRRRGR